MSSEVETSLTVVCETQRRLMTKDLPRIQNFIGGEFVEPQSGRFLDNIEPATGKPYSQVADSGKADVDLAVAAAEAAFTDWSKKPAAERSKILLRIADLIERDLEKLSRARSTFRAPPATSASSPPRSCIPNQKRTLPTTSRSTTHCASHAASRD